MGESQCGEVEMESEHCAWSGEENDWSVWRSDEESGEEEIWSGNGIWSESDIVSVAEGGPGRGKSSASGGGGSDESVEWMSESGRRIGSVDNDECEENGTDECGWRVEKMMETDDENER